MAAMEAPAAVKTKKGRAEGHRRRAKMNRQTGIDTRLPMQKRLQ